MAYSQESFELHEPGNSLAAETLSIWPTTLSIKLDKANSAETRLYYDMICLATICIGAALALALALVIYPRAHTKKSSNESTVRSTP